MKLNKIRVARDQHASTSKRVVEGLHLKGKRVRKFFATKDEAGTSAELASIQKENFGRRAMEWAGRMKAVRTHHRGCGGLLH